MKFGWEQKNSFLKEQVEHYESELKRALAAKGKQEELVADLTGEKNLIEQDSMMKISRLSRNGKEKDQQIIDLKNKIECFELDMKELKSNYSDQKMKIEEQSDLNVRSVEEDLRSMRIRYEDTIIERDAV